MKKLMSKKQLGALVVALIITAAGLAAWVAQLTTGLLATTNMGNVFCWGLLIGMFAFCVGFGAGGQLAASYIVLSERPELQRFALPAQAVGLGGAIGASVAIIADLNQVWAIANVKEKDLHLIQDLESVEIQLIAMPDQTFSGEIYHVNEMLDPESRSVEVIIACDNHDRQIKPAMYGHVRLIGREKKAIRIPTSALLQDENSAYVLRSIGNNRFIKQPVTTGNDENGETIVFKGLTANDSIVVAGAFYLLDIK